MSAIATERDLEMLAWLAERDMEAVAHAHGQFLAATDPEATASLGRTYQRVSRCLRTTLALKMKAQAERGRAPGVTPRTAEDARELIVERRVMDLQDAVTCVALAAIPDPEAREERLSRFDLALDDWMEAEDFASGDLHEQVLRACRLIGLPDELAAKWRTLPRPQLRHQDWGWAVEAATDDSAPDEAAPPPAPHRDTS